MATNDAASGTTPETSATDSTEVVPPLEAPPVEAAAHVNAPRTGAKKVVDPTPEVEPVDAAQPVESKYPVTTPVPAEPVVVAEPVAAEPVVVAEPVVAPADVPVSYDQITPASEPETITLAETTPVDHPVQEVVIVDAPVAPKKKTNRLAGLLYSLLATVVFTALFAAAVIVIGLIANGAVSLSFLAQPSFYFPALLFFLALVIVVAVVNNAGWWTYIITSVAVGAGVYFGTAAILLISAGVATMSRQEANAFYFDALINPLTIAAALIAREVAIWTGAILGARGRKVRVRNAEAREAYEREQAELTPTATV